MVKELLCRNFNFIVKSRGTHFANGSIHGNRAAVWYSENQVTGGLDVFQESKFVFMRGSKKRRGIAL